jgi:hypothetical protein
LAGAPASSTAAAGIVVDDQLAVAFVADAEGMARAVVLADGRSNWVSGERAFPLALSQGKLVALASLDQFGMGMLLLLDPASGAPIDRIAFDLPETVSADTMPQPQRQFEIVAAPNANGVRLHWQYQSRPLRGAVIADPLTGEPSSSTTFDAGVIDLALDGTRALAIPVAGTLAAPPRYQPDVAPAQRLPGLRGVQFRAADDRHVLESLDVDDPLLGPAHRWIIHARDRSERLGSLVSAFSQAPFLVQGSTLVYRTGAVGQRTADGAWTEQPTRLVGYDLEHEIELWSVPVLELKFRGAMPP